MPKRAQELSAVQLRRLKKPGLHAVGGVAGLHLQVTETGDPERPATSWVLRATVGDRRRDIGLGGFPDVPLAQARDRARDARDLIRQGIDPVEERRKVRAALIASQAATITFDEAADKYLGGKLHEFKNRKHAAQWRSTLQTYASPVIGKLPVAEVTLPHIRNILEPIWLTKTETAGRLRGRIESVMAWATVSGYRAGDNPARWKGNLDSVLAKPGKIAKVQHHRALPVADMPGFIAALREREGVAARALEFLALTAARSGEVKGATWEEIDLAAATWTIPAERMKAGRAHRVPLSKPAVALLRSLPRFEDNPLIFPAPRGGVMSDMALIAVMRRMGVDAVPHGLRSTFRDWCAENMNYPREIAEAALAHVNADKVEAAYLRTDLFDKRRRLMRDWATFCTTTQAPADVVPIRRERA